MRVLIVSWEFPPLVVGGLGRHVGQLARHLAAEGHDVRVLTRGTRAEPDQRRLDGVTVWRAAADGLAIDLGSESVLAWAQAFEHSLTRAGLRLVADWRPDVIHAHDWLVAQTAHTLHEVTGSPVVATVHATEHGRQQGWLPESTPRAIHSVERWLCRDAAAVIACSRFMAAEVSRLFQLDPARVRVIGNGPGSWLPVESRSEVETAGSNRAYGGEPLLAFAGRLVHEKGLQELIKALPLLCQELPGMRLVVAGAGQQLAAQQDRAARYRVSHLICWAGFLDAAELTGLLAAADLVVVPSLYEPFGMVALEAQLAGTPVAVSDTGGLAELVEPGVTGLRFAPESPAAIAAAVREVVGDPEGARQRAARAQRRAQEEFGWPALARRTAEVYASVRR
ncbi:MAG TPA: glycosyltransferase family 4 protein [Jatrophihabitans sp.]|uniref:glycosyltransferase family 4 protein n=1 Tax=Jatrophihabitans sp. TaxID=1932789 RepID=UPI002EF2E2E9